MRLKRRASSTGTRPGRLRFDADFRFTADGHEYFRIWIVNLLLTLLTAGLYSPWAKVRRTRYFWQNTWLDGFVFDYHGDPQAILRGRLIALVLLTAYTWAFQFSSAAGVVTVIALCVSGPWLFMKSQRFKLANTSYRGLRFGFDADLRDAYRRGLPILVVWFAGAVVGALAGTEAALAGLVSGATTLLIPWMHHGLKAYQHSHALYGDQRFVFDPVLRGFYRAYLKGLGVLFLAGLVSVAIMQLARNGIDNAARTAAWTLWTWIVLASSGLAAFLIAWPYYAARLQQIVWAHTRLRETGPPDDGSGEVRFRTEISALTLFGLVAWNVGLTLLTVGLY